MKFVTRLANKNTLGVFVGIILLTTALFVIPGRSSAATQCPPGEQVINGTCTDPSTLPGAVTSPCQNGHTFLGLIPWYQYLTPEFTSTVPQVNITGACNLKCFNVFNQTQANECGQKKSDIPLVALAIVDDLLRIAGLVALGFVIYGAIKFTTSQGNPDDTTAARNTIVNALIGLVVAMVAVALVSFIGNQLGG